MTSRRGRPQLINVEDSNIPRKINFNYSENFNRIIELNTENYVGWRNNMLFLLTINDLVSYATQEKVKKLRKRDIKENLSNYIVDQFDDSLVYDKRTNENGLGLEHTSI